MRIKKKKKKLILFLRQGIEWIGFWSLNQTFYANDTLYSMCFLTNLPQMVKNFKNKNIPIINSNHQIYRITKLKLVKFS